jgi:glycosyltransferase involved in cell wall biosynthesis
MISIIIPTLNEEKLIGTVLADLRKDFTMPHEIIVTDGKSTDKTVEIARKYADKVIEYTGTARQTIAQGRNDGARAAVGDYLVFFDADCFIKNKDAFFKQAISNFEKNPNVTAVCVNLKVLPENERFTDKLVFGTMNLLLRFQNNVLHHGESPGEFQMMKKSTFEKLHGYREDLVTREDADMFLRLSKIGRTVFDPKLTVYHTGRRAHNMGWFKLLSVWMMNVFYVALFNKAKTKEWKVIR